MVAVSRLLSSPGTEGCQCVNNTDAFASLSDRICQLPNGGRGIRVALDRVCVPFSFGASQCLQHDMLHNPSCRIDEAGNVVIPEAFCFRPWCYVDADQCSRDSHERVFRSVYFPSESGMDVFYSYDTCNSTEDDWLEYETRKVLEGISFKAVIPDYQAPYMYKRDPNNKKDILSTPKSLGSEYYDGTMPFEGVYIDYMEKLVEESNGDIGDILYTHRSRVSSDLHPNSTFTASVQDVADGLADMALGPIWITAERLAMVPFTMPIVIDKVHLVIPKEGLEESLSDQLLKVLLPFSYELWGFVVGTIVFAALVHVWLSDPLVQGSSQRNRMIQRRKKSAYVRLFLDGMLQKGTEFSGGGVSYETAASLPAKVADFGFAVFVLVVVSTYTANLAAFLTRSMTSESVTTMEGVVAANYKICAYPVLEQELRSAWPKATFYFTEGKYDYYSMLDDYHSKKCKVLAIGWEDTSLDEGFLNKICDSDLVYTDTVVLELPMAFPITPKLNKVISHWMAKGSAYPEALFQETKEDYLRKFPMDVCNDYKLSVADPEENDYIRIEIANIALPFVFFFACVLIAVILRLVDMWMVKNDRSRMLGRSSGIPYTAERNRNAAFEELEEEEEKVEEGMPQPTAPGNDSFEDFMTFMLSPTDSSAEGRAGGGRGEKDREKAAASMESRF